MYYDENSILLNTDSYKISHWPKMYPPGMNGLQSNFESRTGATWNQTVFFGLQYILKKYLVGEVVTKERVDQAEEYYAEHLGPGIFYREMWDHIIKEWSGHLPVTIKAIPEGTPVDVSNVLMLIESTDAKCAGLVNWLESLLVQVWYPCTVATQSREIKRIITDYVLGTGGTPEQVDWMLVDFGLRGSTSREAAAIGGASHLLNFFGSDTNPGNVMLKNYYGEAVSHSIPASEHSTVTTWGEDGECDFLENCLDKYPVGMVANVIDSFNPKRYITEFAAKFKDRILNRDGKVIFRPDSGIPKEMIVNCLNWLGETFGCSEIEGKNGHYKLLPPQVGLIYGDGMDINSINDCCWHVRNAGWAVQNVAFGSGGGLLQKVNRDTQRFAFKANWCSINGEDRDVFKAPSSDPTKNSKRGRLMLVKVDGPLGTGYSTLRENSPERANNFKDELVTVFSNGHLLKDWTTSEVRNRCQL